MADDIVRATAREDLSVAQLLMSTAYDQARWLRRIYDEFLEDSAVDVAREEDARRAFEKLDEVIEARAFARDSRQTVRFLRSELDRLAA